MSKDNQNNDIIISTDLQEIYDQYRKFSGYTFELDEIQLKLNEYSKVDKKIVVKEFFRYIGKQLADDSSLNKYFDLNKIPATGIWSIYRKIIVSARVNELKQVKIVQRRKKYDLSELRSTFYGKKILEELPELGKRWIFNKEEYNKIKLICNKLKIELPEIIMLTTTEVFFNEE